MTYLDAIAHVARTHRWQSLRVPRESLADHLACLRGTDPHGLRVCGETWRHAARRAAADAREQLRLAHTTGCYKARIAAAIALQYGKADRLAARACEILLDEMA